MEPNDNNVLFQFWLIYHYFKGSVWLPFLTQYFPHNIWGEGGTLIRPIYCNYCPVHFEWILFVRVHTLLLTYKRAALKGKLIFLGLFKFFLPHRLRRSGCREVHAPVADTTCPHGATTRPADGAEGGSRTSWTRTWPRESRAPRSVTPRLIWRKVTDRGCNDVNTEHRACMFRYI